MRRLLLFYPAGAGFAMLKAVTDDGKRESASMRGDNADELQAERRVGTWILIFLILIGVVYLGVKLASRDINRGGPTIESE